MRSRVEHSIFHPCAFWHPIPYPEPIISADMLDRQPGLQSDHLNVQTSIIDLCTVTSFHKFTPRMKSHFLHLWPVEQFCRRCVFFCAAGGLCEQARGWRGDRYGVGPGGDTLHHQPWAHGITALHRSSGPQRVPHHHRSAHTHVEEVRPSLPSVLHTITHLCLIDLSHHWSVLFLPSSCSNICSLKCVKILPFLYLDEPMAHYIISWLRNHKEFNDSAFFNMEVFKLFNAKDPQLRKYFYKGPLSNKSW